MLCRSLAVIVQQNRERASADAWQPRACSIDTNASASESQRGADALAAAQRLHACRKQILGVHNGDPMRETKARDWSKTVHAQSSEVAHASHG
eukprot:16587-Heterococcus_DN1.PRE.5